MMQNTQKERDLQSFAERLNDRLDAMGYPSESHGRQTQLSKDIKADQKAVRRWLKGIGYPRQANLAVLASFLGMPMSILKFGVDENVQYKHVDGVTFNEDSNDNALTGVPIFSLNEVENAVMEGTTRDTLPRTPATSGLKIGATLVQGTSMDDGTPDGFPHGSYVHWTPSSDAQVGDHVIAKYQGGVIIRTLDIDGEKRTLRPLNSQYSIISDDFEVLAIIVGKYKPVISSIS